MKKFLSVLLTALVFVSMFTTGAAAYSEFELPETDGHIYGFVYRIDDKVFFSNYEAIKELGETGETTVYLPEECNGKYFDFSIAFHNRSNYTGNIDTYVPGSVHYYSLDEKNDFSYRVNFVCSEDAEYDFENQIATSDFIKFFGYINFTTKKAVFLNHEEIDTLISTGKLSLVDDSVRVFDEVSFFFKSDGSFSRGSESTANPFINRLERVNESVDGNKYIVIVNENASVFDDNCLFGILKGIFGTIFDFVLKIVKFA